MRNKVCSELSSTRLNSPVTCERSVGSRSHHTQALQHRNKEAIAEYTLERRESEDETLSRRPAKGSADWAFPENKSEIRANWNKNRGIPENKERKKTRKKPGKTE